MKEEWVTSFDGLYDANHKAELYNFARRRRCWFGRHKWIHAALQWYDSVANRSIDFPGWEYNREQAGLLKSTLFCCRCKTIKCVHWFDELIAYKRRDSPHYHTTAIIGQCKFCTVRIYLAGCGVCEPSKAALDLMAEMLPGWSTNHNNDIIVAQDANGTLAIPQGRYGSAWFCEIPVIVSQVLDERGVKAARAFNDNKANIESME